MTIQAVKPSVVLAQVQTEPTTPDGEPTTKVDKEGAFWSWLGVQRDHAYATAAPSAGVGIAFAGPRMMRAYSEGMQKATQLSAVGLRKTGMLAGPMLKAASTKVGPAIVFGLLGPAVADGVSMLKPEILSPITTKTSAGDQKAIKTKRMVAAGVIAVPASLIAFKALPKWFGNTAAKAAMEGVETLATQSKNGLWPPRIPQGLKDFVTKFAKVAAPVTVVPAINNAGAFNRLEDAVGNVMNGNKKPPTTKTPTTKKP